MQIIKNNPYRILGLLVGTTAKEHEKQLRQLKQYLEIGQTPKDDYSFPVLGPINRTIDSITEADSKLNLDADKMNAAIFWFYNGYPITDEPALEALKSHDLETAMKIWYKLTQSKEITPKNSSAFHNFSTLLLNGSINGTKTDEILLEEGLSLKLKFLESNFVYDFKAKATDKTYTINKKEIQLSFFKILQNELENNGDISPLKLVEILSKISFSAREDFIKSIIQRVVEHIESEIEVTKSKHKVNKVHARKAGEELYQAVINDLYQLKSILSNNDFKYITIADKVANEILQCSIDYFNDCLEKGSETKYFQIAMELAKKAKSLAEGNLIKDRIAENITALEEMKDIEIYRAISLLQSIKDAYETNKTKISRQAKLLEMNLSWNQRIDWSKVNQMINDSIDWDKVVQLIEEVIPPSNVEKIRLVNNTAKIEEYKSLVNFVFENLNWSQENRVRYIRFWKSSASIGKSSSTSGSSSNSGGCYIATMAYGNYDHPQVLVLRRFRDEVLANYKLGRKFINAYYYISPKLVDLLKNRQKVKKLIREGLDQFIRTIKG